MKFYFDGCSFSYGGGLSQNGYDPHKVRWTKLVSDYFGAEEFNFSTGGASNDTILRHFFTQQVFQEPRSYRDDIRFDLKDFDVFFIQSSSPRRGEYWNRNKIKWERYKYSPTKEVDRRKENPDLQNWIQYWLSDIYHPKHGVVREIVMMKSILSHLKLLNKPYFTSTIMGEKESAMDYDLYFNAVKKDYFSNQTSMNYDRLPCGHPSPDGHRQIADDVIKKLMSRKDYFGL
tara:strand:- start:2561 stop:3253 length:693 start_codon:yes stop_codon:yes gene_type:complete